MGAAGRREKAQVKLRLLNASILSTPRPLLAEAVEKRTMPEQGRRLQTVEPRSAGTIPHRRSHPFHWPKNSLVCVAGGKNRP
jgi:hypothetical protein